MILCDLVRLYDLGVYHMSVSITGLVLLQVEYDRILVQQNSTNLVHIYFTFSHLYDANRYSTYLVWIHTNSLALVNIRLIGEYQPEMYNRDV